MSVLIKRTCCVIIYLRLWAHRYWTRTNDPQCNWRWKEECVSSALNSVQCWPVSRQPGVGTKVSYGALLGVFPLSASPPSLLHSRGSSRPTDCCGYVIVGAGPSQSHAGVCAQGSWLCPWRFHLHLGQPGHWQVLWLWVGLRFQTWLCHWLLLSLLWGKKPYLIILKGESREERMQIAQHISWL